MAFWRVRLAGHALQRAQKRDSTTCLASTCVDEYIRQAESPTAHRTLFSGMLFELLISAQISHAMAFASQGGQFPSGLIQAAWHFGILPDQSWPFGTEVLQNAVAPAKGLAGLVNCNIP